MSNKSNKRWTKRKHRNGKRPERKGSLKVNLQELPGVQQYTALYRAAIETGLQHFKELPNIPHLSDLSDLNNPEWCRAFRECQEKTRQWEEKSKQITRIENGLHKTFIFLSHFKQADTIGMALDVINEVQPKAPILFYVDEYCNGCKKKDTCPLLKLDWSERSDHCKKMDAAYQKFCAEVDSGTYQRPADYWETYQKSIAKAWEISTN